MEVKSAAYVQTWEQARISEIAFGIRPAKGWDTRNNTSAATTTRSADVYVFCRLKGEDHERIDPLDGAQWSFFCCPRASSTEKYRRRGRFGSDR